MLHTAQNIQPKCTIETKDFAHFLQGLKKGSVDLMLTDPPYAISRDTGFANVGAHGVERFAVSMDFGEWDKQAIDLRALAERSFAALRTGGTAIIFYDLWKLSDLARALIGAGFVQLRFIEWLKTNPVPLNSKSNYLTNSREVAVCAVKGGKPTFHGEYDNGQYHYAIPRRRQHPTQKPLALFEGLIKKHSNAGDLVIDPFLGSGTTALACCNTGRHFSGCDISKEYTDIAQSRMKQKQQYVKANLMTGLQQ